MESQSTAKVKTVNNWKNFRYFRNEDTIKKVNVLCEMLSSQIEVLDIVVDFLLNVFNNDCEQKKEATYLLNQIISSNNAISGDSIRHQKQLETITIIINLYLEPDNWNLPIDTQEDEFGITHTLSEVQNNILQICLQLEGIGNMALICGKEFHNLLLKTLYPIVERVGSGNVHLKESGLHALMNISKACGYENIMELIYHNSDYFSFHIAKKLKLIERNRKVLNVFCIVMNYSNLEVLPSISNLAERVSFTLLKSAHQLIILIKCIFVIVADGFL